MIINPTQIVRMILIALISAGVLTVFILRSPSGPAIEDHVLLSQAAIAPPTFQASFSESEAPIRPGVRTNSPMPSDSAHRAPVAPLHSPSTETARGEVEKSPHTAPKSLIQFANQIADRFDEVEKSPDQADSFMTELEDCVKDQAQNLMSARALCLTNAEDLAAMFPTLKSRFQQLKKDAPTEVVDLSRATLGMDPAGN